jgi:hypothetical protein
MNRWKPCKRNDFLRRMRKLGFDGPFSGARHQFMLLCYIVHIASLSLRIQSILFLNYE